MPPGPLARAITGGVGPDNDFLIWAVVHTRAHHQPDPKSLAWFVRLMRLLHRLLLKPTLHQTHRLQQVLLKGGVFV